MRCSNNNNNIDSNDDDSTKRASDCVLLFDLNLARTTNRTVVESVGTTASTRQ